MLLLLLIVLSFPVLCMGESAIQSEGNMSYIITSEGAVIIDWNNQYRMSLMPHYMCHLLLVGFRLLE